MKCPYLEWFTSEEPILTLEERQEIIRNYQLDKKQVIQESIKFKWEKPKEFKSKKEISVDKSSSLKLCTGVSEEHLKAYVRWRKGRQL